MGRSPSNRLDHPGLRLSRLKGGASLHHARLERAFFRLGF